MEDFENMDREKLAAQYSLDNPVLMEQFKLLASWSKRCIETLETYDMETVGKSHPDHPYVLAMCAKFGMFDPMLALHMGNVAMYWIYYLKANDDPVLKLMKMTTLDRMTLILRSLVNVDAEVTHFISMLLYAVDLIAGYHAYRKDGFEIGKLVEKAAVKAELQTAVNRLKRVIDDL